MGSGLAPAWVEWSVMLIGGGLEFCRQSETDLNGFDGMIDLLKC